MYGKGTIVFGETLDIIANENGRGKFMIPKFGWPSVQTKSKMIQRKPGVTKVHIAKHKVPI